MANQKYDNLTVLMTTGGLNWSVDPINAYLMQDVTYDATDIELGDTGGTLVSEVPVPGRQVDSTGSLLGRPVSFNRVPKDQEFQMIIGKVTGPNSSPLVLAFYDADEDDDPLSVQNNGTLIVRPQLVEGDAPPQVGVWVAT